MCFSSLVLGETIGRVTIGPEVQNFCPVVHVQGADESWDNFALTSIQRDKKFPSNFLATVGNGLYSIDSNGLATVLAGSDVRGNANGPSTSARFKLAAGLVQLSSNFILISDQKNQCIRQFNRTSGTVSQFAGRCNLIREYDSASYRAWETFNSPTKLLSDGKHSVFILDTIDHSSVIVSKNLKTLETNIFYNVGSLANDFLYDDYTSSFVVSSFSGIYNISKGGVKTKMSGFAVTRPHGLASQDGILLVSDEYGSDTISISDLFQQSKPLFNLCGYNQHWELSIPFCQADNMAAIAIVDNYLYFSSTDYTYQGDDSVFIVNIMRIEFNIYSWGELFTLVTSCLLFQCLYS